MVDVDLYWLAGFLEGEGSFLKGPPSSPGLPIVSVVTTDGDVAERVANLLGVKTFKSNATREIAKNWKPAYSVRKKGFAAVELMKRLYPHMSLRRKIQIEDAINSYSASKRAVSEDVRLNVLQRIESGQSKRSIEKELRLNRTSIYRICRRS